MHRFQSTVIYAFAWSENSVCLVLLILIITDISNWCTCVLFLGALVQAGTQMNEQDSNRGKDFNFSHNKTLLYTFITLGIQNKLDGIILWHSCILLKKKKKKEEETKATKWSWVNNYWILIFVNSPRDGAIK